MEKTDKVLSVADATKNVEDLFGYERERSEQFELLDAELRELRARGGDDILAVIIRGGDKVAATRSTGARIAALEGELDAVSATIAALRRGRVKAIALVYAAQAAELRAQAVEVRGQAKAVAEEAAPLRRRLEEVLGVKVYTDVEHLRRGGTLPPTADQLQFITADRIERVAMQAADLEANAAAKEKIGIPMGGAAQSIARAHEEGESGDARVDELLVAEAIASPMWIAPVAHEIRAWAREKLARYAAARASWHQTDESRLEAPYFLDLRFEKGAITGGNLVIDARTGAEHL